MRHFTILFLVTGLQSMAWGQEFRTPLSLMSSAGSMGQVNVQSQVFTVEWTIGETFIGTGSVNNQSIGIGQQQGIPNMTIVSVSQQSEDNLRVYPNPAGNYIQIDNLPEGVKEISLYSMNGTYADAYSTSNTQQTISTTRLPSGIYLLVIFQEHMPSRSFKIAISNN